MLNEDAEASVIVFDFDLTLTRWDTADRFFRWLLKRDWWRFALVSLTLPVLVPMLVIPRTRKWPVRFAVWVATLGRNLETLRVVAEEHARTLPCEKPVFLPDAIERLRSHLDKGQRVVIATGCLEPLARALLSTAGLDHVPLVASTLRPFLGGLVSDEHCFGRKKVTMLAARGYAPPWAIAYTDHRADLPVIRLSAQHYLITPTPECRTHIERALGCRSTVLEWR